MQENAQNTEAVAGEADTSERAVKKTRKSPEREEIRLAKNPAKLISKEGFALYIGKTVDAVVAMAKAAKAPA
ncbi:TPA: hypothetical protein N3D39_004969, partial [Salmonella enterica subsp. enterica serovar Durban]|nr:hypothetical protein [Salmonella enterica]HCM2546804.1 hypothetical protein [Salmonella enterica subsp. enterica serovar Durban]